MSKETKDRPLTWANNLEKKKQPPTYFKEMELIGEGAEEEAQWFLSTIRAYKDDHDRLLQTAKTLEAGMENDRLRLSRIIRLMEAPRE